MNTDKDIVLICFWGGRGDCEIAVQQHQVSTRCGWHNGQERLLQDQSTQDNHQLRSSQVQAVPSHITLGFLRQTVQSPRWSHRRRFEAWVTLRRHTSSCSLHRWPFGLWTQMPTLIFFWLFYPPPPLSLISISVFCFSHIVSYPVLCTNLVL